MGSNQHMLNHNCHCDLVPARYRHGFFSLIYFFLVITTQAQEKQSDLPWQLARVYWDLPRAFSLETISIDIVIMNSIPDSSNFFVVPIAGSINGYKFYAGCITNIPDASDVLGRPKDNIGRGLIFSKWGDLDADSIRPGSGGYHLVSSHEGQH